MNQFFMRQLITGLISFGAASFSIPTLASAYQLWEQSAATVGNYHAGYAADALDASISFYNPAGITRFNNQQLVVGVVPILTSFKYKGNIGVSTIDDGEKRSVTAQGGTFNLVPNLHYVAPINDWLSLGFSIVVPFGLKTDYGRSTILRYAATLTSVDVLDISPALAIKATDKFSFGAGLDIQRMHGNFDLVAGLGMDMDTNATTELSDTGYGGHIGILYEFTPSARIGFSYHSQVVHHLTGSSKFIGPIADQFTDVFEGSPTSIISDRSKLNMTLPSYTALSGYWELDPQVAIMGSIIYTQWSTVGSLMLQDIAGIQLAPTEFGPLPMPSRDITVTVPQSYNNTWSLSLGANFNISNKFMLRSGIGYDQSPVRSYYRNVQLPDGSRYAIALGGHYQANKAFGMDLGWTHLFMHKVHVYPPVQSIGFEEVETHGKVSGGADVFGAQITWDMV